MINKDSERDNFKLCSDFFCLTIRIQRTKSSPFFDFDIFITGQLTHRKV